jgi:hypothetical protein
MVSLPSNRWITSFTAVAGVLLMACAFVQAEQPRIVNVSPSDYDAYAATQARNAKHHARPANTPEGRATRPSQISNLHSPSANPAQGSGGSVGARYPGDLQYQGGPVVESLEQHLVYVNLSTSKTCSTVATCWGNPGGFLRDLGKSDFIHVTDQYIGSTADDRYTVSNLAVQVTYPTTNKPLTDVDMQIIVHAVAAFLNTPGGYRNLFHIFLVPGQDECFDSTFTQCYSPDIPNSFFFCAYHGSVTFHDIGHVLYSVEPFQVVPGCSSRPNTPNGQLVDSTNNVLSHETFETITDPDGDAWFNLLDVGLFGDEIGDECEFIAFLPVGVFFDPSDVTLDGRKYAAQPEYNNARHACTIAP